MRGAFVTSCALALAACGGGDPLPAAGDLVSARSHAVPAAIAADGKLLVYRMTGQTGKLVDASALLFVPRGSAPASSDASGRPVVVWIHPTTTLGNGAPTAKRCAPSESPELDGGLAADGLPVYAVETITALVGAGYAVVAVDLEGQGAEAERNGTPQAYYNLASAGRAVTGALLAAHKANSGLSRDWAVVGHSEGGHAALGVEAAAAQAQGLNFKGTVAFAPFTSVQAAVTAMDAGAAADPANAAAYRIGAEFFVGMISQALATQNSTFQLSQVMGSDLLALMPKFQELAIMPVFGALGQAIASTTPAAFQGHIAQWADNAAMRDFLATNDPAVISGFRLAKPTLVLQGMADQFVFEPLQTPFVNRLKGAGMPVSYKTYANADHSTIVLQGLDDMLAFLATILR